MARERAQRRLAAIMAADVVGYSRLMGEDEIGTLSALKEIRARLIDPTIAEYRGRTVKLMGDGLQNFSALMCILPARTSNWTGSMTPTMR